MSSVFIRGFEKTPLRALTIAVFNRQRRVRFDLAWLKKIARVASSECATHPALTATSDAKNAPLSQLDHVEVTIVSDEEIARVHEQFMQIAGATDVVTFEHGEIVISAETAKENAARFSQPLDHELALCLIHGLLHLHGHDDQRPREAQTMRALQQRILKKCLRLVLQNPQQMQTQRRARS